MRRVKMLFIVLAMACIVWLLGERNAYRTEINELQVIESELVDNYFDLQQEHEACFHALFLAETRIDTLVSHINKK